MMKTALVAALFTGALALPAMAANNSSTETTPNQNPQNAAQVEQDIRQDLSKAGFSDIRIAPGSFMVHAKDSRGNPTEMVISPNSVTELTALNPSGSGHNGTNNGSSSSNNK
jgi:uncharacterized membrane protein YdfJ with MMPL/SSD domain